MTKRSPSDLRRYESQTTRNLVVGFFGLLLVVGGGLILLFYGPLGLGAGVLCIGAGAALFGLVLLVTFSFGWIADWIERRDQ
ncbi:MAG: hypothetical protein JNL73_19520 [Anaerolineales bacterium]|nr:hypothetical protein [Anaerolineales bacterium]